MSDRLSIGDIAAARNQKLATEQTETTRIAAELEGAHQDALALKHQLRQQEGEAAVPQQQVGTFLPCRMEANHACTHTDTRSARCPPSTTPQAFPHGSAMASAEPSKEHTGVGETVAEGIANADQVRLG